jgi:uncharacterized OB-fold protein
MTEENEIIVWQHNENAVKIIEALLQGIVMEIRPQIDPQTELGFSFPGVEQIVDTRDRELLSLLESLADQAVLERKFTDKFLYCPQCGSLNLAPGYYCPKCSSGNIVRGRVLEHVLCKHVDVEDEFTIGGRLMCPKCKKELYVLDSDYRSLGILRRCRDCGDVFSHPAVKWRCLKCSSVTPEEKVLEVNAYTYFLAFDHDKRNWLEFELKHKPQLVGFLQERGYEVEESAKVKGRSGAEHVFDMLARKNDGVMEHRIAIGIENATKEIGLDHVFSFDDKAYDCSIHDKILVVIPPLQEEAANLAQMQRIKVIQSWDLDSIVTTQLPEAPSTSIEESFEFKSRSGLVDYLEQCGYEVDQYAVVKGKSGAEHTFDLLAARDDGIVAHRIAIGIEVLDEPIGVDKVFDFDDKAYDCGILDKIFIAVPGLTSEARRLAERQRIKVFEVEAVEPEAETVVEEAVSEKEQEPELEAEEEQALEEEQAEEASEEQEPEPVQEPEPEPAKTKEKSKGQKE